MTTDLRTVFIGVAMGALVFAVVMGFPLRIQSLTQPRHQATIAL
jgi:hypothetical protein